MTLHCSNFDRRPVFFCTFILKIPPPLNDLPMLQLKILIQHFDVPGPGLGIKVLQPRREERQQINE